MADLAIGTDIVAITTTAGRSIIPVIDNTTETLVPGLDRFVTADPAAGNRVKTLPDAATNAGVRFRLDRSAGGSNTLKMAAGGSDTIAGAADFSLINEGDFIDVISDGTVKWRICDSLVQTPTVFEIYTIDNFPNAPAAGEILLPSGKYNFHIPITISDVFRLDTGAIVQFSSVGGAGTDITYTGTSTLFISSDAETLGISDISISLTGTNAQLFDLENLTGAVICSSVLFSFDSAEDQSIGIIKNVTLGVNFDTIGFIGFGAGIIIEETPVFTMRTISMVTDLTGGATVVTVNDGLSIGNMTIDTFAVTAHSTDNIFCIDPTFLGGASINRVTNSLGANFFKSGSTGAFTAVADASFTSETITSVTDSSGVARFNFTAPPTLFVGQEVTIVGFVTNTAYNITGIITATAAGYFEISSIAFGTDEAGGSFTSDTVTITDAAHGLSELDKLQIDTTLSIEYDGGYTIYNVLTNTFQINKAFVATEIGTWDTGSLTSSNSHVRTANNTGELASGNHINAYVNNNAVANGAIVNNTFTDMVFGTGGSGLIEAANSELWKLVDEVNGILAYTGDEPFEGTVRFSLDAISTGGNEDFRFKFVKDDQGDDVFVDLTDDVQMKAEIGGNASHASNEMPLQAIKGDQIKPQITRNAGTSGITTEYYSVNVSSVTNI